MYGAYEGEALAPKGKLRVIPYICSGTALVAQRRPPAGDRPLAWSGQAIGRPGVAGPWSRTGSRRSARHTHAKVSVLRVCRLESWISGNPLAGDHSLTQVSGVVFGANPARCASIPTATAISTATLRSSLSGGRSEAVASLRAGEFSPRARAAAKIIPSVTRRARHATTPNPMAGKIYTLLHCAMGMVRPP
jgi:hypothetical protein